VNNNQEELERLNLVLSAIRGVQQLLIKEKNRVRLIRGICQILIKDRSYFNVWITLFDETKRFLACAQAGLGKEFSTMKKLLKREEVPDCVQTA